MADFCTRPASGKRLKLLSQTINLANASDEAAKGSLDGFLVFPFLCGG